MYMGLAWLSLFFSWNVHMVVEATKVLKKRRHRHRYPHEEKPLNEEKKEQVNIKQSVIDIFKFLSEQDNDNYNTIIKEIGIKAKHKKQEEKINRSKSCNDLHIQMLDHSPGDKHLKVGELFRNPKDDMGRNKKCALEKSSSHPDLSLCIRTEPVDNKNSENVGIIITVTTSDAAEGQSVQHPDGGETRFTISKVPEDLTTDKDEMG